tara:strand:- start:25 stop:189 length:165 start_codon:yes stop_codon:yes gene_type:complete
MMIWNALKQRDIKIPFPQRLVTVNEGKALPQGLRRTLPFQDSSHAAMPLAGPPP